MLEIPNDIRRQLARCPIGFEHVTSQTVGEADEIQSRT